MQFGLLMQRGRTHIHALYAKGADLTLHLVVHCTVRDRLQQTSFAVLSRHLQGGMMIGEPLSLPRIVLLSLLRA